MDPREGRPRLCSPLLSLARVLSTLTEKRVLSARADLHTCRPKISTLGEIPVVAGPGNGR